MILHGACVKAMSLIKGLYSDTSYDNTHQDIIVFVGMKRLRFKPAYNPYTEPSMEVFSYHEGMTVSVSSK